LATSRPGPGEKNRNTIAPFVKNEPFASDTYQSVDIKFDNKIKLLGWSIQGEGGSKRIVRGKNMVVNTYWHCENPVNGNYKVFMHIDGPGGRIHGDHDPVEGIFPTGKWTKGDYIKDAYTRIVPLYQKKGKYTVRLGLYKGSKRLPILDQPLARENSLLITTVKVE
jgi:hypothetical protein